MNKTILSLYLITLTLFTTSSLYAVEVDDVIGMLDFEKNTSTSSSYERVCLNPELRGQTIDESNFTQICNIFSNSPLCQAIEPEKRVNCNQYEQDEIDITSWNFISNCASGIWRSIKEMVEFLKDAVVWLVTDSVDFVTELAKKIPEQSGDFYSSVKNYFSIEWQKAMDEHEGEWFQRAKASRAVFHGLIGSMVQKLVDKLTTDFNQLGCYAPEHRSEKICKAVADLTIPPTGMFISLFSKGTKYLNRISNASKSLDSQGPDINLSYRPDNPYPQAQKRHDRTYGLSGKVDELTKRYEQKMEDLHVEWEFELDPRLKAELEDRMKEVNNQYVKELNTLYMSQGILTTVGKSSREPGVLVLNVVPKHQGRLDNRTQQLFRRAQEKFGGDSVTISLYETTMEGSHGFQYLGRIELGPEQAALLPINQATHTAKHELRHLMLYNQRSNGTDSIYNQSYKANGDIDLDGNVGSRPKGYSHYMTAQEVYTFSRDVGTHARNILSKLRQGDHRGLTKNLQNIKTSAQGVTHVATKAQNMSRRNGEFLSKAYEWIKGQGDKNPEQLIESLRREGVLDISSQRIMINYDNGISSRIDGVDIDTSSIAGIQEAVRKAYVKQQRLYRVATHQNEKANKIIAAVNTAISKEDLAPYAMRIAEYSSEFSKEVVETYKNFAGAPRP
tara:strand:- start:72676 stop:74694 length:2019 start_codon:yes stop_codon:yes gene_type:complete